MGGYPLELAALPMSRRSELGAMRNAIHLSDVNAKEIFTTRNTKRKEMTWWHGYGHTEVAVTSASNLYYRQTL